MDGDEGSGVSGVRELGSIRQLEERVVGARQRNLHVEIALERNTRALADREDQVLLLQTVPDGPGILATMARIENDELCHDSSLSAPVRTPAPTETQAPDSLGFKTCASWRSEPGGQRVAQAGLRAVPHPGDVAIGPDQDGSGGCYLPRTGSSQSPAYVASIADTRCVQE